MEVALDETRGGRIAEIGRRANALRRAGFYTAEEVKWLADYVKGDGALLIEVEFLLGHAEGLKGLR